MDYTKLKERFELLHNEVDAVLKKAASEGRGLTAAEKEANKARFAEMDNIKATIDEIKESVKQRYESGDIENFSSNSFSSRKSEYAPGEKFNLKNSKPKLSLGQYVRAMVSGPQSQAERFALVEGTIPGSNSVAVDSWLSNSVLDMARDISVVGQLATFMQLQSGTSNTVSIVSSDPTPSFRNELGSVAESTGAFTSKVLAPKSLAVTVRFSRELAEDSPNLSQMLYRTLAGGFASEIDKAAINGNGVSPNPLGVFYDPSVPIQAITGALTRYEDLVTSSAILKQANHTLNAVVMGPSQWQFYNTLKDSTNQPLQVPPALKDVRFLVSSKLEADDYGTGRMLAGDFSAGNWLIGVRSGLTVRLLTEAYASTNELALQATYRLDFAVARPSSMLILDGITFS